MPRPNRREHLINTAIELFCENGYHATGIDHILKVAGVSKKTMYSHFRSKEELIMAALKQYDGVFRNNFMKAVEECGSTPTEKLLGIFEVAENWFRSNNFFGCMFINAVGEYSEHNSPIRDISKQFKAQMRRYVLNLTKDMLIQNPENLSEEIVLLLEGAIVTAQVSQNSDAAKIAKRIAKQLIDKSIII